MCEWETRCSEEGIGLRWVKNARSGCDSGTVCIVSCWESCVEGAKTRTVVVGLKCAAAVSKTAVCRGT